MSDFLYLSRADIAALALTPAEIEAVVEAAFRGLADGGAESVPKLGIDPAPGTFFHAMPARVDASRTVGVKWVGVADNASRGLPHINAILVLSDLETAVVKAVMEADTITGLRPAAVSLIAARRLARPDSSRIGFIACGLQARSHMAAFAAAFPLRRVACYSRNPVTSATFAAALREQGYDAQAVTDPRAAIEGQDIVVTSIPRSPGLVPYLDPAWIAPGAFVSAPDLARCWHADGLREIDILATDDRRQSREAAASGHLPWQGDYAADLCELVNGLHRGRSAPGERAFFVHPGLGLGDIAIAGLALERAVAMGIGTRLPR